MAVETVHEAFEQGLNYFDTSPFYGEGLSEIVSAGETLALSITHYTWLKQHCLIYVYVRMKHACRHVSH